MTEATGSGAAEIQPRVKTALSPNPYGPRTLGVLLASLGLLGFLALVALRLTYPFELEWMEGITLFSMERLIAGQPLYAPPDFNWCPLPYGPVYFEAARLASLAGFAGFVAPRLISVLASLGLFWLLGALAGTHRGQAQADGTRGLVAAGFLALAYPFCGAWLDVARPDALAFMLMLGACWNYQRTRDRPDWPGALVTVALALASFHTKQTALLPLLGFFLLDLSRAKFVLLGFLAALGTSLALASVGTSGWYEFYTFDLLAGHGLHWAGAREFLSRDLVFSAPLLVLAGIGLRGSPRALIGLAVGGFLASFLGRLHPGGYDNVLLPLVICAAPLGARGWAQRPKLGNLMLALMLGLGLWIAPGLVPSAQDRKAGEDLVQRLEGLDGGVFSPAHGALLARAGKQHQLHLMSWMDLSASDAGIEQARALVDELEQRLSQGDLSHALLGAPRNLAEAEFVNLLRRYLPREQRLLPAQGPGAMIPVSGAAHRPELLLSREP